MDKQVKAEPTTIYAKQSYSKCRYCQAKITDENELLPRIDYIETEILKQQIQNMKLELYEKDMQL